MASILYIQNECSSPLVLAYRGHETWLFPTKILDHLFRSMELPLFLLFPLQLGWHLCLLIRAASLSWWQSGQLEKTANLYTSSNRQLLSLTFCPWSPLTKRVSPETRYMGVTQRRGFRYKEKPLIFYILSDKVTLGQLAQSFMPYCWWRSKFNASSTISGGGPLSRSILDY